MFRRFLNLFWLAAWGGWSHEQSAAARPERVRRRFASDAEAFDARGNPRFLGPSDSRAGDAFDVSARTKADVIAEQQRLLRLQERLSQAIRLLPNDPLRAPGIEALTDEIIAADAEIFRLLLLLA